MLRFTSVLFAVVVLLAVALPAQAEERIALVIGNGAYEAVPVLPNAPIDATLMAATLRGLGFEVIERTDASRRHMMKAIKAFGDRLTAAGADGVGLFYYAGHGVQAGGVNYLIPLSAEIADESDLEIEAISANTVLRQMEWAGTGLNLIILDACRNNPYAGGFRSVGRGLARMLAPRGSLISYATEPGGVAADGAGANSPYTAALAQAMAIPGLPVEQMFKQVRRDVLAATDNAQTTWESSSLTGEFYFVPAEEMAGEVPSPTVDKEALFWKSIKDSTNPEAFRTYLEQFPDGVFAGLAALRIEELEAGETEVASLPPATETPVFEIEEMEAPYRVVTRANLRAGPSTDYDRAGQLEPGAEVTVTGKVKGRDWYRVALADGGTGYVYAPLLGEEPPAVPETQVAVVTPVPQPSAPPSPAQPAVGVYSGGIQPGVVFRDCATCPEMVVVPSGIFTMGSPASEEERLSNEGPQHRVTIPAPFAVGRYEVTFADWDACVARGGCNGHRPSDSGWGRGDRPVFSVSWDDAQSYVVWLSRKTGQRYRLLSESEWEYVARAETETAYWWGSRTSHEYANYGTDECCGGHASGRDRWEYTSSVGSFPANAFGLYDVLGNVWEWVEDCWHGSYSGAPDDGAAWTTGGDCGRRVLRGGSWGDEPRYLRAANRYGSYPDDRDDYLGFRIARTF